MALYVNFNLTLLLCFHLQLTKIEQGAKSSLGPGGPRVVDIKKYLAQAQPGGVEEDFSNDIWQREKNEWMRHHKPETQTDYLSDDVASNSSTANNVGHHRVSNMTRSISGKINGFPDAICLNESF